MLIVRIFSLLKEILVTQIVGALIQHPAAAIYADGVTSAEVRMEVSTVTTALIAAALEVPVLIEDDLKSRQKL